LRALIPILLEAHQVVLFQLLLVLAGLLGIYEEKAKNDEAYDEVQKVHGDRDRTLLSQPPLGDVALIVVEDDQDRIGGIHKNHSR